MRWRWFKTEELGIEPEAPAEGELVWIWIARTERMSEPLTLNYWDHSEEWTGAALQLYRDRWGSDLRIRGWRGSEQAFNIDLFPGDMVCRVLRPEVPRVC